MKDTPRIVAIVCADIHLSAKPPLARASEPDWFLAMEKPLRTLAKLSAKYDVPILCAGDVFDRWNSSPELINFALDALPPMYAIPGQHDMPEHSLGEMRRSAYTTLQKAGKLQTIPAQGIAISPDVHVWGFGWGEKIVPPLVSHNVNVALVHGYIWKDKNTAHVGANPSALVADWCKQLKGYQTAVFGDNHIPFDDEYFGVRVFNCGGFMRRRSDESEHIPRVGLLRSDGFVAGYLLGTNGESFEAKAQDTDGQAADFTEFVRRLESLSNDPLDFEGALRNALTKCDEATKKVLLEALHGNS